MGDQSSPQALIQKTLVVAAQMPGVRVDRAAYLRSALRRHCSEEQILSAIEHIPSAAGVAPAVIDAAAKAAIRLETTKVTALSTAAGIPGGLALLGTVPADAAQYLAHMLRISQKLAYLYGWPDLFDGADDDVDDATMNVLVLFLGVMVGAQAANGAVTKLSQLVAEQVVRRLPQQALTQGIIYPLVKQVARQLGVRMTKQLYARGFAKMFPVLSGAISGGVTLATFAPMSYKLRKHLATGQLAQPQPAPAAHDLD